MPQPRQYEIGVSTIWEVLHDALQQNDGSADGSSPQDYGFVKCVELLWVEPMHVRRRMLHLASKRTRVLRIHASELRNVQPAQTTFGESF